jgi:parvulin-like peptidyl-prolyl isomerase
MRRYTSRRKKALRNLTVVTIIFAIGFLATKIIGTKSKQGDVLVATIGKEKIYKSEIERKLQTIFADEQQLIAVPALESLPKEVVEIVVKEIFSDRQILKLAKKEGFDKDAKLIEKIVNFQEKTFRQAYLDSIIEKEITKEKISEKYAEISNSLSGKKEYQIAHILLKSKEDADKVILEINSKKAPKFSELAKKYSLEQQSAQNGGDLGYILEDNITKEIADELINLKIDDVSSPIKTKLGWHLVKLINSREAKAISFEESKDKIREQLIQNKINELNNNLTSGNEVKLLMEFEKEPIVKDNVNKVTDNKSQNFNETNPASEELKPENSQESNENSKDNNSTDQTKTEVNLDSSKSSAETKNPSENKNIGEVKDNKNPKSENIKNEKDKTKITATESNEVAKANDKKPADKNSGNLKDSKLLNSETDNAKSKDSKKIDNSKNTKNKNNEEKPKTKN